MKRLFYIFAFFFIACNGPENRQPETAPIKELPAQADSGVAPPKDGTDVESDTTDGQ